MDNTEITMNGVPLSSMGVTLVSGAYSALLMPAALKDFVENNDPLKDGTDVIVPGTDGEDDTSVPRVKERDVTLTFLIQGENATDFMAKYAAFVAELHKGTVVLHVPDLGRYFHLLFSNCTQFNNYLLNACNLAVKFREPNPRNNTNPHPDSPDNSDITTDEFGISWYKKRLMDYIQVSTPLAIPDLASFSRNIDGETIYYYSYEALLNILNQVKNLYNTDDIIDPIFLMVLSGVSQQYPPDYKTVWNINDNNTRADVVVTYPAMGYYKDGVWQPYDTYFGLEYNMDTAQRIGITEIREKGTDPSWTEKLTDENVAIPIKLCIQANEAEPTATVASMLSNSVRS